MVIHSDTRSKKYQKKLIYVLQVTVITAYQNVYSRKRELLNISMGYLREIM
jgi:hypothetical protein